MLKWIALILMLVDHYAYIMIDFISKDTYIVMRLLGRLSFPIFAYYVVLGVGRTSRLKTYMTRLLLFAIISEAVIRMLGLFTHSYVNIIFSLFLYAAAAICIENKVNMSKIIRIVLFMGVILLIPFVEYGYSGFLVFLSLPFVHKKISNDKQYIYASILITLSFLPEIILFSGPQIQWFAGFAGLLMFNEKMDKRVFSPMIEKWTFYIAYPVQWFIFAAIYILLLK